MSLSMDEATKRDENCVNNIQSQFLKNKICCNIYIYIYVCKIVIVVIGKFMKVLRALI